MEPLDHFFLLRFVPVDEPFPFQHNPKNQDLSKTLLCRDLDLKGWFVRENPVVQQNFLKCRYFWPCRERTTLCYSRTNTLITRDENFMMTSLILFTFLWLNIGCLLANKWHLFFLNSTNFFTIEHSTFLSYRMWKNSFNRAPDQKKAIQDNLGISP